MLESVDGSCVALVLQVLVDDKLQVQEGEEQEQEQEQGGGKLQVQGGVVVG